MAKTDVSLFVRPTAKQTGQLFDWFWDHYEEFQAEISRGRYMNFEAITKHLKDSNVKTKDKKPPKLADCKRAWSRVVQKKKALGEAGIVPQASRSPAREPDNFSPINIEFPGTKR